MSTHNLIELPEPLLDSISAIERINVSFYLQRCTDGGQRFSIVSEYVRCDAATKKNLHKRKYTDRESPWRLKGNEPANVQMNLNRTILRWIGENAAKSFIEENQKKKSFLMVIIIHFANDRRPWVLCGAVDHVKMICAR